MNKDLKVKALELIQNGKYEEAYEIYSNAYDINSKDFEALYLRSLIDFGHLRKKLDQTIPDLEFLASFKNKYAFPCMHLLVVHYDMIGDSNRVIIHGEKVKNVLVNYQTSEEQKMLIDVYYLLARAYYFKADDESLNNGLNYIDSCIKTSADDVDLDYYLLKLDILLVLKKYDDVEKEISNMQATFGINGSLYLAKEKLAFSKGLNLKLIDFNKALEEFAKALEYLEIYAKYEPDNKFINYTKVEIYTEMKEYEKALNVLDLMEDDESYADLLIEKIKIYELLEDIITPIKLCEQFLLNYDSWKIKYSLGYLLAYNATDKESLLRIRDLFLDAYHQSKKGFVLYDLYPINNKLFNFDENYELLIGYFDEHPDDGRCAYLLAMMAETTSKSYDEQYEYLKLAKYYGYINTLEFLDEALSSCDNPKIFYKILKKYQNKRIEELDCWSIRKMGVRYLYGESGYHQDLKKAKIYLEKALEELPEVSCMHAMMGRFYEFSKDYDEMINYYNSAHNRYLDDKFKTCNCSEGYLAHIYINGIGVKQNIDYAKDIILKSINDLGNYSSGIVIYLYTYFALGNDERFSLNYAEELLNKTHAYKRYEITRYILLKQVLMKLNKEYKYLNKMIKQCLKFGDKSTKKYYKENINKEISYPLFSEF